MDLIYTGDIKINLTNTIAAKEKYVGRTSEARQASERNERAVQTPAPTSFSNTP